MFSEQFKKNLIVVVLGLLTVSAFFIRLDNFKDSTKRSIDEIVYYRMARQIVNEGLSGYNTIPYGKEMAAAGRALPGYFFHPLFKYPPLFCFLLVFSFKIFGMNLISAAYIPILFGVLLIPLSYWIGRVLFNRIVGILSALLMFYDPVTIITSQKVWMDTPLAFFTAMNVLFLILGVKKNNGLYFIFGGIACGLAVLTKYPGILGVGIYIIYAYLFDKKLFSSRSFLIGLSIPFIMLIPWFYWNYKVYGIDFISFQINLHSNKVHQGKTFLKLINIFLIIAAGYFITVIKKVRLKNLIVFWKDYDQEQLKRLKVICGLAIVIALSVYIARALQLNVLPVTSWSPRQFNNEPFIFYFGRLLEFSLIYIFAYFMLFLGSTKQRNDLKAIKVAVFVILFFYSFWGNLQSRYILGVLPLLLVLAASYITIVYDRIVAVEGRVLRYLFFFLLFLFIFFSLTKTHLINLNISFPNDLCFY